MTLTRQNLLFLLLSILFFLSSCKGIEDIQFTGADDFELKGMENNKVIFSASISISNPSSLNFKVSEVNLKTSVDGSFIGILTSNEIVKIAARSDSSYRMNFSLDLANLLAGASTLYGITRKKQVTVDMQGYVKARSWFTFKKVTVRENRLIDVPSNIR
jgi:LEA14-like dessication related protein